MRYQKGKRRDDREPKKTVSIEVRVSEEEKRAFHDACVTANRSASSVLRRLMARFVSHRHLKQRICTMMKHLILHPARAALASLALAAVASAAWLQPPASVAEEVLAFRIWIDDGSGMIVSQGVVGLGEGGAHGRPEEDWLGEGVRYRLTAQACAPEAPAPCDNGGALIDLHIEQSEDGVVTTVTDSGVVLRTTGETRFEATLNDGRRLSAVFLALS